jgi:hypothetical protein
MKPLAVCIFGTSMFFYGYGKESVGTVLLTVTLFLVVLAMGGDEDER